MNSYCFILKIFIISYIYTYSLQKKNTHIYIEFYFTKAWIIRRCKKKKNCSLITYILHFNLFHQDVLVKWLSYLIKSVCALVRILGVIFFIFNDFVKPFLIGMNACCNKFVLTQIFFKKKGVWIVIGLKGKSN